MTLTTFLDSSMVEHAAVNRGVVGSSPTRGAILNTTTGFLRKTCFVSVGAYSSAVEPPAHNRLVPGSIPGGPTNFRPVGQAVKTPPFHGGIGGSIPPRVTKIIKSCAEIHVFAQLLFFVGGYLLHRLYKAAGKRTGCMPK